MSALILFQVIAGTLVFCALDRILIPAGITWRTRRYWALQGLIFLLLVIYGIKS